MAVDSTGILSSPAMSPEKGDQPMRRTRHRNGGIRKRCGCPPRNWPKCPHGWHLNFKPKGGPHYRISLDKEVGKHLDNKSDALAEAERIRTAIRNGTFRPAPPSAVAPSVPALTFGAFADVWKSRRGCQLASGRDDAYRLTTICAFVLPGVASPTVLGEKTLDTIMTDDIEAFRDARKAKGLSASAINHDLRLLRKMFNWAIRKGYLARTAFKIGSEAAITLEREIPRNRRLPDADAEQRLLDAANPHLRGVITAMLDTACRPGEILSLQWRDVSFERRELTIRAEKEKTRRERIIPISKRLIAILEMRRNDPAGRYHPPDAYVFGDALGRRVKSVHEAWTNARNAADLGDFQLRDLRHEAASRFDEAGVPIVYVSSMLGHSNLSTTSRYLNIHRRGLHLAMQKLEESRTLASNQHNAPTESDSVAQPLHTADSPAQALVQDSPTSGLSKRTVQ
jgi:integrase